MADIVWGPYQVRHIERRHAVSSEPFDQAWHDPHREDFERQGDGSVLSLGFTHKDKLIEMLWRWDERDPASVFPLTACFPGVRDDVDP